MGQQNESKSSIPLSWNNIDEEIISSHSLLELNEREKEIYKIVYAYAINGQRISHDKLSYLVDLDRKRLRVYTTNLMEKGMIRREEGLHGRYYPTIRTFKESLLKAELFSDNFRKELLSKDGLIATQGKDSSRHAGSLDVAVSEFSNRIGAFVAYSLIEAMTNLNGHSPGSGSGSNNDLTEDPRLKDILIKRWTEIAITNIIPHLPSLFKDFIDKSTDQYFDYKNPDTVELWTCRDCAKTGGAFTGESYNGDRTSALNHKEDFGHTDIIWGQKQKVNRPRSQTTLQFDNKELRDRLHKAFAARYPVVDKEFKKIFENMPSEIDSYKKFLARTFARFKQQEHCDHQYDKPAVTLQGYYRKQCVKCHYLKKVGPSEQKKNS
jgi:predicted transcriptional regulator